MRHFKRIIVLAAVALGTWQSAAVAATAATATYTVQQLSPNSYEYDLTLNNAGTTSIESFWFGWIPGYDLLQSTPTSVSSPSGWTGSPVAEALGTSSVLWTTGTAPLQPGQSVSGFVLDTADAPSVIAGSSQFGYPVAYSYVYSGAPFTSSSALLTAQPGPVPEPAVALLSASLLLLRRRRLPQ